MNLLKFGLGNAKVGKHIHTFTLQTGYTCPGARDCLAKVKVDKAGKASVWDGPEQEFRCFQASIEALRPNVRAVAEHNTELLKAAKDQAELILASLPENAQVVRVHVGGDFFSEKYFLAWLEVARRRPGVRFYAYTKSLHFWVRHLEEIPENFRLTASEGGKFDHLIARHGLKTSKVVFSMEEAAALGLEIDHDDSHAYEGEESFALLIHGAQKAGSAAAKALSAINRKQLKDPSL